MKLGMAGLSGADVFACWDGPSITIRFSPTAVGGGRKNAITQSFLVRSGCHLDVRQLLQRVSQLHHHNGVNLNMSFHFPFFFGCFHVFELQCGFFFTHDV